MRQGLNAVVVKVLKRLHYPLDVILLCVRRYSAYLLNLRNLEEMMAERGISVDHSTVHRWAIKLLLVREKAFRRSKRKVGRSWRMDETYIKVKGGVEVSVPCRRQGRRHRRFLAAGASRQDRRTQVLRRGNRAKRDTRESDGR